MRTNIEIDDMLMADAMEVTGAKTKREVVHLALTSTVRAARRLKAYDDLRGIGWDGDLDAMRTEKPLEWG